MINMLNEKLFIFIWFWLAFLLVANVCSLIKWVWNMYVESSSIDFIMSQLVAFLTGGMVKTTARCRT